MGSKTAADFPIPNSEQPTVGVIYSFPSQTFVGRRKQTWLTKVTSMLSPQIFCCSSEWKKGKHVITIYFNHALKINPGIEHALVGVGNWSRFRATLIPKFGSDWRQFSSLCVFSQGPAAFVIFCRFTICRNKCILKYFVINTYTPVLSFAPAAFWLLESNRMYPSTLFPV